jgi:hypothetical protein
MVALGSARDSGKLAAAKSFAAHTYRAFGADAIGLWNFDDVANIGKDSSQYNSGFSLGGTGSPSSSGPTFNGKGSSLTFSTNWLKANVSSIYNLATGTVSGWVKTNSQSVAIIFGRGTHYGLTMLSNGVLAAIPNNTTAGSAVINDDKWHYIAQSFKRVSGTIYFSLYFDGKLVGSNSWSSTPDPSRGFAIGNADTGGYQFSGTIDDVALYSQSLTASEIYNLYASQASKYGIALSP